MENNNNNTIYYATSKSVVFCKYTIGSNEHSATASATATARAFTPQEAKAKSEEISEIQAEKYVRQIINKINSILSISPIKKN